MDITLQIKQEIVSLRHTNTSTNFNLIDKRNSKNSDNDKRYAILKQWKVAQSLAEDVYNTTIMAQDINCHFHPTKFKSTGSQFRSIPAYIKR